MLTADFSSGFIDALALLFVANGAPIVADCVCRSRLAMPVDFGIVLSDGNPLFGASKTFRGIVLAVLASAGAAAALGYAASTGALFGTLAMSGDLFSSFAKRRFGLLPSAKAPILDQLPESLLPAAILAPLFELSLVGIAALVGAFSLSAPRVAFLLHRAGVRRQPH